MKFVDVFQFFNYLLEEMSRCNCFSLQLVGGLLVGRTLEPKGEVWKQTSGNEPQCRSHASDNMDKKDAEDFNLP